MAGSVRLRRLGFRVDRRDDQLRCRLLEDIRHRFGIEVKSIQTVDHALMSLVRPGSCLGSSLRMRIGLGLGGLRLLMRLHLRLSLLGLRLLGVRLLSLRLGFGLPLCVRLRLDLDCMTSLDMSCGLAGGFLRAPR